MFSEDYLPVYLINLLPLIGRISYGRKDIDDNHTNSGMKIFFALKFNKALCRRYYNLVQNFSGYAYSPCSSFRFVSAAKK